jgi:spore coat protein U-like protein
MSHPDRTARPASSRRTRRAALPVVLAGCLAWSAAGAAINCNVSSGGVSFGDYDPLATTADDTTGNVVVTCTRVILQDPFRVDYTLSLSRGTGGGNYAPRRMSSGPNRLNYNLYRDAARAQVWGDGTGSTSIVAGTANFNLFQTSQTNTHTAYGRAPALQDVLPGSYSDTVVVQITF